MATKAERFRAQAERSHPKKTKNAKRQRPAAKVPRATGRQSKQRLKDATPLKAKQELQLDSPRARHDLRQRP